MGERDQDVLNVEGLPKKLDLKAGFCQLSVFTCNFTVVFI